MNLRPAFSLLLLLASTPCPGACSGQQQAKDASDSADARETTPSLLDAHPSDGLGSDAFATDATQLDSLVDGGPTHPCSRYDITMDQNTLDPNQCVPCVETEPTEVHFGGGWWGVLRSRPVELRTCPGTVVPVAISGIDMKAGAAYSSGFDVDLSSIEHSPSEASPLLLRPGEPVTVQVTYFADHVSPVTPDCVTDLDKGVLSIRSDAPDSPMEVPVDGAGVECGCPSAVIQCAEGSHVELSGPTTVHLDGTKSVSDGLLIVKWKWTIDEQPAGSTSVLQPSSESPMTTLDISLPGFYRVSLEVWDSCGNKSPMAGVWEIQADPTPAIAVYLTWHTPADPDETDQGPDSGSDLDLHFTHPLADQPDQDGDGLPDPWFDPTYDCFTLNKYPNWTTDGGSDPATFPKLLMDDTDGGGPEITVLQEPEALSYRVGVHYFNAHGFGPAFATVQVYFWGILTFEAVDVELADGDLWDVATIDWPSSLVTPSATVDGSPKVTHMYEWSFPLE